MFELLLLVALVLASTSGVFLRNVLDFRVSQASTYVPMYAVAICLIILAIWLPTPELREAIMFLAAAFAQFTAFVFVSRLRQRGSFFWHSLAALASNGTWFVTVHILAQALDAANIYLLLVLPYIAGIVAGRLTGVQWAQYIEQTFGLTADATRDPNIEPGKRVRYIACEKMFWVLLIGLVGYAVFGFISFEPAMKNALAVVIGLGLLQNFCAALDARARSRGNRQYAVITSIAGGVVFFVNATYLFSKGVPFELFVPYAFSTALGSTLGAFFSMIIEWTARIAPDTHVKQQATSGEKQRSQMPVISALIGGSLIWLVFSEQILHFFGVPAADLTLPVPLPFADLPRELVMLAIVPVFFLKNALHGVTSRAGSRNHAGYHATACILTGLFDFFVLSYLALNAHIVDIIPVAVLVGALGTLAAMQVGEFVEKRLEAVMDVAPQNS